MKRVVLTHVEIAALVLSLGRSDVSPTPTGSCVCYFQRAKPLYITSCWLDQPEAGQQRTCNVVQRWLMQSPIQPLSLSGFKRPLP